MQVKETMGTQAHERQDELFDLRFKNRCLLHALILATCGDDRDRKQARIELEELATDPLMAKNVISAFDIPEMNTAKYAGFTSDVLAVARLTLGLPPAEPASAAA